jgi:hypothetical protein
VTVFRLVSFSFLDDFLDSDFDSDFFDSDLKTDLALDFIEAAVEATELVVEAVESTFFNEEDMLIDYLKGNYMDSTAVL